MQKRKKIGWKVLLLCVFGTSLLCGCQHTENVQTNEVNKETVQSDYEVEMELREGFVGEEEYEQNFARPQVNSNIFVDLMGYAPEDQKYAYFVGDNLSEVFYVLESATNKRVYTGTLKKMDKEVSDGKSVYKGDFSLLAEPGVYYIQTAIIGQSYTFRIDEGRYLTQHEELLKEFCQKTPEDYYGNLNNAKKRTESFYSFQKLVTAYQFFAPSCGEEYEKKLEEHAQWLLALREDVLAERAEKEPVNYNEPGNAELQIIEEDYRFATSMAAGYFVLRQYNNSLAGQCLYQAQKAYQNAARFRVAQDGEEQSQLSSLQVQEVSMLQYMAAAALYRASSSYTYHAVIKDSYKLTETDRELTGKLLWGNLFYMTSLRGVDTNICDKQMSEMMSLCGEYLNVYPKSAFGLIADKDEALESAIWLAMADYIVVSREYRNVCKEQIHSLLHNIEEIDLSHEQKSTLILLLGNLAESEETE